MSLDYHYLDIAKMIDHSLLNPTLLESDLEAGCQLALAYDVASVCIMPYALKRCTELLRGSTVRSSTTIGFPHGGHAAATKVFEAEQALRDGCQELDMVVNISQVLSEAWGPVEQEIKTIVRMAHATEARVKVIFENCYLQESHKIRLCEICSAAGADWVKTSTGYGSGGATLDDLRLMRRSAAPHVQVKAAGGIRDLDGVLAARAAGATRCGASRSAAILDECRRRLGLPAIAGPSTKAPGGY